MCLCLLTWVGPTVSDVGEVKCGTESWGADRGVGADKIGRVGLVRV